MASLGTNGGKGLNNGVGGALGHQHSVRTRAAPRRSGNPNSKPTRSLPHHTNPESERVRVAVRLRPRNAEDVMDYADCVELQPELNRLKLRKNNWSSESYRFDEIFTQTASQKRVYEAVAKPVVESVLEGYNGTVMAYGQTGTGKTHTLGRLGKDDAAQRGIMIRALEDILATILSPDTVHVSYLQLYMESIQDLLAPEKTNISIVEDAKTGEVTTPSAELIQIRNLDHLMELLGVGEANRHAANTKMNTESSRSHAILMVHIRRSSHEQEETNNDRQKDRLGNHVPTIRKSKLLIVDLAGSERLDKSGSEGHLLEEAKFINLSLTCLGKCINALAENSPHIPTRDSKLTRLLRDSFGGSARTSLIITIGPSSRHHAETASTVMFGQRAMKVVNSVKVKEEFDYEGLCQKLGAQVDHLSVEIDRQQKSREKERKEMQRLLEELKKSSAEAEAHFTTGSELLQKENTRLMLNMKDLIQELDGYKRQIKSLESELINAVNDSKFHKDQNSALRDEVACLDKDLKASKQRHLENSAHQKMLADAIQMYEEKIADLEKKLEDKKVQSSNAEDEVERMKEELDDVQSMLQQTLEENTRYRKALADNTKMYEDRIEMLNEQLADERNRTEETEELYCTKRLLQEYQNSFEINAKKEINELQTRLQEMHNLHLTTANELRLLNIEYKNSESEKAELKKELGAMREMLQAEERRRKEAENKVLNTMKIVPESEDGFEDKESYMHESKAKMASASLNLQYSHKSNRSRETILSQRNTISKICEEVGLEKILSLLESNDLDVQIHAVKVVANLAAEDINQERIVQEGGLDALLKLLESSHNTTILRVASGAIANLAMNEMNQGLIANKGGAKLLANAACKTDDPQTLRMAAGALANLCGNEKLHLVLKDDGAIKALLQMTCSGNADVIAQVARGFANFAKCESRRITQGHWRGRSLLMEDGALRWLVSNLNASSSSSTRRHIELAICHLAQNEENRQDFITSSGRKEVIKISSESTREDIRNLAKKAVRLSPIFQEE